MVYYKSINQKEASLAERESYLGSLNVPSLAAHVFLQTCNRVEDYAGDGEVPSEVIRHLYRLTSGLESALLGERAIQGQVREAYHKASEQYHLSGSLHKLFQSAIAVGRRVRNETLISQGAVSHSLAAVEIMEKEQIDFKHAFISIIGVNKLTEDTIKFLKNKGANTVFLANRSLEKAQDLAGRTQCQVYSLKQKTEFIPCSDVLISATSAPHLIVRPEDINPLQKLLIIDLAFPRDVDERLRNYPNVSLYNLQDIERAITQNLEHRKQAITLAEKIIEEEVEALQESLSRRKERSLLHSVL